MSISILEALAAAEQATKEGNSVKGTHYHQNIAPKEGLEAARAITYMNRFPKRIWTSHDIPEILGVEGNNIASRVYTYLKDRGFIKLLPNKVKPEGRTVECLGYVVTDCSQPFVERSFLKPVVKSDKIEKDILALTKKMLNTTVSDDLDTDLKISQNYATIVYHKRKGSNFNTTTARDYLAKGNESKTIYELLQGLKTLFKL